MITKGTARSGRRWEHTPVSAQTGPFQKLGVRLAVCIYSAAGSAAGSSAAASAAGASSAGLSPSSAGLSPSSAGLYEAFRAGKIG